MVVEQTSSCLDLNYGHYHLVGNASIHAEQ